MEPTYYFNKQWDETTDEDATENWGRSVYYFETDYRFNVLRQMQIFENGKVLKYDLEYVDDKYGGLAEYPIDPDEYNKIDQVEFEQLWQRTTYKRFPEIVCTNDVCWGQPRLEGRRLTVGDIVRLVDMYHEDLIVTMNDYDLSLQQIRQALHYCKLLQCKTDQPERYCYNCLLRVEQFNESTDADNPEQPNWERAAILIGKYF